MKRSDMTIAKSLVCFLFFSPFTSAGLQQGETALLKKTRLGVLPTKTGSATKRPAKGKKLLKKTAGKHFGKGGNTLVPHAYAASENEPVESACRSVIDGLSYFLPGEHICSSNGLHTFGLSNEGDLGIWRGPIQIWSAGTCCKSSNSVARLQKDGNFVVRNDAGIQWSSRTRGVISDTKISLNNDGSVAIVNKGNGKMLVINSSVGNSLLWTPIPTVPAPGFCMNQTVGRVVFHSGQFICSRNRRFSFGLDLKGKLGLFEGREEIWSVGQCCTGLNISASLQKDGNFVLTNASNQILWSSRSSNNLVLDSSMSLSNTGMVAIGNPGGRRSWAVAPNPPKSSCHNQVVGSLTLFEGEFICSPNAQFRFGVFDGDLSLWEYNLLRWSTGACCSKTGAKMILGDTGRLAVVNSTMRELWFSDTGGNVGASLRLGNDGKPQVLSTSGRLLWTVGDQTFEGSQVNITTGAEPSPLLSMAPSAMSSPIVTIAPSAKSSQLLTAQEITSHAIIVRPQPSPLLLKAPQVIPSLSVTAMISAMPVPLLLTAPQDVPASSPTLLHALLTSESPTFLEARTESRCVESTSGPIELLGGDYLCSPNGRYKFGVSFNGELEFLHDDLDLWKADGCGYRAGLSQNGDLVLYDLDGSELWSTNTTHPENDDATLFVGDDGVATIRSSRRGYVWSTAIAVNGKILPDTMHHKAMTGYQGWFHAKGDGGWDRWVHWSVPLTTPDSDTVRIDLWPDMSELDADELFPTSLFFANGSEAPAYSASRTKTVERHCRWMQDYGIDGLFLQRFIGTAVKYPTILDQVLSNVRSGSEKYGRVFAVMYDIGNGDNETLVDDLINDWKHLVDEQNITASGQYLCHRGRPLLSIWGLGFSDRFANHGHAMAILDWFQFEAEDKYKVTLMGGVPAGWRDLSRDSKREQEWENVYHRFDVISPWTVGRMNKDTVDTFLEKYILPDMKECEKAGIDYIPVVFPGFSARNLRNKPLNEIPRLGGDFMWHQMYNILTAGSSMFYVAMFDELDEGTAIFKVAATQNDAPVGAHFLTLDAEGDDLPSDWYLQLVGEAAKTLRRGVDCPVSIPIVP